ncbi:MAG: hypothetical protein IPG53_03430 [Ignavibacteriales bacterium]|nr:hypothetical protein [Ignavibacteriales bacterium]
MLQTGVTPIVYLWKKETPFLAGYNLGMDKNDEPDVQQYVTAIGAPMKYSEIVFCGYGEPTIRWDVIKKCCPFCQRKRW